MQPNVTTAIPIRGIRQLDLPQSIEVPSAADMFQAIQKYIQLLQKCLGTDKTVLWTNVQKKSFWDGLGLL